MIDFQHKLEIFDIAQTQIKVYSGAAGIETFLMRNNDWGNPTMTLSRLCVNKENMWLLDKSDFPKEWSSPKPEEWKTPKTFTTRENPNKDPKIWKLLNEDEKTECDAFLDAWGEWRARNSIVTLVEVTRQDHPTSKVDINYMMHNIDDVDIRAWDFEKNRFNQIRMLKWLSTDEQLREEVIPSKMKMLRNAIILFRRYDVEAMINKTKCSSLRV